ncbi:MULTISPECIES: PRC-barrel domain-containing protein [Streptomyces]|uniref:PRC-barrel domain-containing protein n=1 Tax=Streptomyces TaxID=1883 RepID=UPI00093ADBEB|nr:MULTISPECIES: PRC-barrel domain-containing protein [Streptomyces]MBX9427418.1 PRC-barrel domain-containing protein [Streptomyces lateritius]OKJ62484.1 PRC domain containing protein [Streptomyces sp. CB02261]
MTENAWNYRPSFNYAVGTDLTGYKVEAVDGSIGKVDKHSEEVDDSYVVVDTGVWIFGKEVLLPANTISRIDAEDEKVYLDLSKEQIKNAPEFHREEHLDEIAYRDQVASYYGHTGGAGPL